MTQDDLRQARIHLWHQDGAAILTTEDAGRWLEEIGFCSLLPSAHPLASLAQAVAGSAEKTPEKDAQDAARQLSAQLMQQRAAVPVFWEEVSMLTGEQFDALASVEVLPYLYCLRGDRDLKKVPQGSPLMQAVWQELQSGPKTVAEIIDGVGRELTEAAILRALRELWAKLRAVPVLETTPSGDGARWDLLQRLWPEQVRRGATMSHPLALSAMISVYLGGAVAASADEVEDALGPLASRSRVREVLNALQATRQVKMFPVGRASAYALSGSAAEVLDEVAEKRDTDALKVARAEAGVRQPSGRSPREFGERKAWARDKKAVSKTPASRRAAGSEEVGKESVGRKPVSREAGGSGFVRKEWKPRPAGAGGQDRPRGKSFSADKPFAARKPWVKRDGADRPARAQGEKSFGERKSFAPRKPWVKREGAEQADRPARPAGERPAWKDRPAKSFGDRPAGERKEWKPRSPGFAGKSAGPRKPWVKREGATRPTGERKPAAAGKPWVKREGAEKPAGERREWKDRPTKSFGDRPAGERKEWKPRSPAGKSFGGPKKFGAKRFGTGAASGPSRPRTQDGDKKFGGPKKFGAKSFGGDKKFGGPKKFGAAKKFSPRPGGGKTFSRDRKPEGKAEKD